ncbi:glycerol-3-phosphate dehydrogenase/oxidase [Microbulbifer spongiae]|uniref:Glycerol-3-phosphate dehydrogenase/oxidase n=1 Tax=Microbulbifer spongiae TaxID=2944933 RepID=A0ABY9EG72_9GAMM|nr:glycerol-3-phosphate dehydrogenase/oxidase [Microbulbifer sp. MI-G]WKD51535.1 glycerol-3-phosphate dehydrogenase/oxidase [Microbulbifer sp. MI-G]
MWQKLWQPGQREILFNKLDNEAEHWDVIIAGGGITGAGIAREAARRGLKTLLLERHDFAWGTSSRSSKMIHGGLRYIAAGDIKTTLHSVHERERLMDEAPGLVDKMAFMMSHYRGKIPGPMMFNILLRIYDFFAGRRYRKYYSLKETKWVCPYINEKNLIGGTQFTDAITDDARLVMRVLREAQKDGAAVINYIGVKHLLKHDDRVVGVEVEDALTGQRRALKAKVVINATGVWVDELRGEIAREKKIRPARGSHIVVPFWRLPVAQSLTTFHPNDGRPIFIYPWEGRTVIGTTDLDEKTVENVEASMTREEMDYLIAVTRYQFPLAQLEERDILSSWAGVRPLIASGALNPSKEKRNHSVWDDNGLVSVSGGKLTTFRLIALDVLSTARKYLCEYESRTNSKAIFSRFTPENGLFSGLPSYLKKRLCGYYGKDSESLVSGAKCSELNLIPGTHSTWAELRWVAANEAVVHLDDLLLRRTRLGLLLAKGGMIYEDKIYTVCHEALGWTEKKWTIEKVRYQKIWKQHYSIPA